MSESLGNYRVGVSANPSHDNDVDRIKGQAASWIDFLEAFAQKDGLPPEAVKLVRIAQRKIEDATMWSVKAVTKKART